jgi:hypothetical protein
MKRTGFPVRFATAFLVAGLLAGPALAAPAAGDAKATADAPAAPPAIVATLSGDALAALLKVHGATLRGRESMSDGSPVLLLQAPSNTSFAAFLEGGGAILQLRAAWGGLDLKPADMNEWNAQYRFTRAWLDDDGDPVLAMDIDITGGVTPARLDDALDTFLRLSLPTFEQFLARRVMGRP